MFGGKIVKSSKVVVGSSYKQHAYGDSWQIEYTIEGDVDLASHEVQKAIWAAYWASPLYTKAQSSYGQLRWMHADSLQGFDVARRKLIVNQSCGMCD